MSGRDLLDAVLAERPGPFAVIHRPESTGPDRLDVLVGAVAAVASIDEIPLPGNENGAHEVLALVPYRQIAERGYACAEDTTPLLAMTITGQETLPVAEVLSRLPDRPTCLTGEHFTPSDEEYAEITRRIVADEIGRGEGANFVIRRSFVADITGYGTHSALSFFRRLLSGESGAYWTFVVHTGDRTLVGATPERHVSLREGSAVMNPISGTYRYPSSGPTLDGVMDFLADRKEVDELYMVLDEELKMMARICTGGGRVSGPHLKEMARLAHTEYFITGESDRDPREILRETMFAPTVTGSPLESACRVIAKYEPDGRGYYSGVLALIGRDERGGRAMDSAILIRTADIDDRGHLRIAVGATLVRHSDPLSEVAETRAKADGLLAALKEGGPARFGDHPEVRRTLLHRNTTISGFWLEQAAGRMRLDAALAGLRVLVVDAEDTFTSMLAQQLRSLGLTAQVRRFDESYAFDDADLVVLGPGPGDPRDGTHPKIAHLRSAARTLLARRQPFLAVCLSHQVLSAELGLELLRKPKPSQGAQREIDLFGHRERVGFYNTFAAFCAEDEVTRDGVGVVEVSRDPASGEVHALRGPHFASVQFHAESVLTCDGVGIVARLLAGTRSGTPLTTSGT